MKSVVLFDLDGTLLNTLPSITNSLQRTFEAEGFEPISEQRVRQLVGKSSRYLVYHALADVGHEDLPQSQKEEILAAYNADYLAHPYAGTKPYPGMVSLLDRLKAAGKKIAVYSNKPDDIAHEVVEHFFGDRFDAVRGFQEGTPRKPDPTGVFHLLENLNRSPEEVIYIGDSEVDAETGKNAGLLTWMVTYGFRTAEELKALHVEADAFYPSVAELSAALFDRFEESEII